MRSWAFIFTNHITSSATFISFCTNVCTLWPFAHLSVFFHRSAFSQSAFVCPIPMSGWWTTFHPDIFTYYNAQYLSAGKVDFAKNGYTKCFCVAVRKERRLNFWVHLFRNQRLLKIHYIIWRMICVCNLKKDNYWQI